VGGARDYIAKEKKYLSVMNKLGRRLGEDLLINLKKEGLMSSVLKGKNVVDVVEEPPIRRREAIMATREKWK